MKIFNVVNSFIGKKGNIGLRTAYILNAWHQSESESESEVKIDRKKSQNYSFSRGHDLNDLKLQLDSKSHPHMGLGGQIPRLLNAYRIYINQRFNHRLYDLKWFDFCFFRSRSLIDKIAKNDVVHLWDYSPRIIHFCQERGARVILDIPMAPMASIKKLNALHGREAGLTYYESLEEIETQCLMAADHLLSPSGFVAEELRSIHSSFVSKMSVIAFGASDVFDDANSVCVERSKQPSKSDEASCDFCFLGNVNHRKGVEVLLKAWASEDFLSDRLHLCGRVYPEIERQIKRLPYRYRANIILPGFVDSKTYLMKADVYVFPSFMEGSAKSVYEAMASGLACIVTRESGSIITDGQNGLIIPAGDVKHLRQKMLLLKNNAPLRKKLGEMAQKKVRRYSWQSYAKMVMKLYRSYGQIRKKLGKN